ncbi:MAG TPA: SpoIID/LytB domain-containing protein [Polyangium sp.]|nr:SpoIID/LytB domain-containing protein [Polyangium sp.]
MDDERWRYISILTSVTQSDRFGIAEVQTGEALMAPIPQMDWAHVLRSLYNDRVSAQALRWGEEEAAAEAARWHRWTSISVWPDALWTQKVKAASRRDEPIWLPPPRPELARLPDEIFTRDGWMSFEDYVARVCTGELAANAPFEAIAAQAIAARTYVARAMRDHPALGKLSPIPTGPRFQVLAKTATAIFREAAEHTRGLVILYQGRLVLANYVAGALWTADGLPDKDPTSTERWVTYNAGKRGRDVQATGLSLRVHPGNRGCMSQNGAMWLANNGYLHEGILRFFYGDDIEIRTLDGPTGKTDPIKALSNPIGALVIAAVGLMLTEGI